MGICFIRFSFGFCLWCILSLIRFLSGYLRDTCGVRFRSGVVSQVHAYPLFHTHYTIPTHAGDAIGTHSTSAETGLPHGQTNHVNNERYEACESNEYYKSHVRNQYHETDVRNEYYGSYVQN
jgi:hypothetical protein